MNITYDQDADAVYIELAKGKFGKNQKIDDLTILDLDKKGRVLGIEILDASERMPKDSLSSIKIRRISGTVQTAEI